MATFVSGRELAQAYYDEVVAPLLTAVPHSAALLGYGSDVLGFDDERSTDHGWGPRLLVFVEGDDVARVGERIDEGLPATFRGLPTRFGWDDVPVQHHVRVSTLGDWLVRQLGFDARDGLTPRDWLTTPQQLLLELTDGRVYHDGLDELERLRAALAWYPHEVWLWLLACQWWRIDQEEPFVGRAAEIGDSLGSRVVAARLARDAMRLAFLLERRYAPYSKWLGTAFARLELARTVSPSLERMLAADEQTEREQAWVDAIEALARRHNELGITETVEPTVRLFHGRPFRVLDAGRFTRACLDAVHDPWLRSLPRVGSIDQFVDSTDVLSYGSAARRLAQFYDAV